MSAWIAFGLGVLLGALLFDQLWRWLYRVSSKLISEQHEYIAELEAASGMSTGTAKTPKAVEGQSPASAVGEAETPKV